MLWDKATDQIAITFPCLNFEPTKCSTLQKLASCYNPVGLTVPTLLVGKSMHQNCCKHGVSWDQLIAHAYRKKWIITKIYQPVQVSQGLVTANSLSSKKDLAIQRLEPVAM